MSVPLRRVSVFMVVGLVLALLPLAASADAAEASRRYEPGAPGVGDPYYPLYGNGGYDVQHYGLTVRYDPATDRLEGVARIFATATANLDRFNLDLVGLRVRSVRVDGRAAAFSHRGGHELVVVPPRELDRLDPFSVLVRYDGVPETVTVAGTPLEAGFMHTDDGAVVAGQPEVAATWFPVNDHPVDRAAYTFRVTVPDAYDVVANGLPEPTTSADGWTTHVWRARDPMISYLATIDIGQWDVRRYETPSGLPVIDAVDPDLGDLADASLARQPEILTFLESRFGAYPFETVGAIVDDYENLFFALETQTRPVYSKGFFESGGGDFVVVHELAHQWFGDYVALGRWQDIWLNEGFASYAEWLWAEREGFASTQEIFEASYAAMPADDPFWDVAIGDPGVDDLFDGAVYTRGAMTLQALRNAVGDDAFWNLVRSWVRTNAYGNGTTEEFVALAERVSGQELDGLFDTWLFTAERPPVSAVTGASANAATASEPPGATDAERWATTWLERLERRLETAPGS